jgi:hypothetical protein
VLYDGEPVDSLKWTPLSDFVRILRRQVPDRIFERCASVTGKAERLQAPFSLQQSTQNSALNVEEVVAKTTDQLNFELALK